MCVCCVQFSRLLTHLLAPTQAVRTRIACVQLVALKAKRRELLKMVINIGAVVSRAGSNGIDIEVVVVKDAVQVHSHFTYNVLL